MPREIDYSALDKINQILGGGISSPLQKQKPIVIEDTPLVEGEPGIQSFDVNPSPLGDSARKNYNMLLQENYGDLDKLEKSAADSQSRLADTRSKVSKRADEVQGMAKDSYGRLKSKEDQGDKILLAMARRVNAPIDLPTTDSEYDASAFQKALKNQMDEIQKGPQDVSEFDKMLAGLGPVLVGLLAGGNAGMDAMKISSGEMDRVRKLMADERKAKIESAGKQLEGTGKLLHAEAEMNKAKMAQAKDKEEIQRNRMNDFRAEHKDMTQVQKDFFTNVLSHDENFQKALLDGDEKSAMEAIRNVRAQMKETNSIAQGGVKGFVGAEQKVLDNAAAEKRAKIAADAAEKRAEQARAEKPPTEGQTNSANAYTSMTKAQQAYDRMLKDTKVPPSMSSTFYDTQKTLFENAKPGMLMGDLMKQVPDASMRRQIQAELDWLAPHLRKVSGAAISPAEYIAEGNRFFPRKGDDGKTVAEKEASRKQTVENYHLGAGRAPIAPIQQPDYKSQEMSREEKIKRLKQLEGK